MTPAVPRHLGRYRLGEPLGRGGMGLVFRAHDPELGRDVAIKVLHADVADQRQLRRFEREATAAARLRHPGIVGVHEVGRDERGRPYIVMDLVGGPSLESLLACSRLPPRRLAEIVRDVAAALQHAHGEGVIHRDVKPENVLIDRATGQPRLVDFGLVREIDSDERLTRTGQVVGTPSYMAPEQAGASGVGELGPATDVYGLGGLLYRGLSGRPPFVHDEIVALVVMVLETPPTPPRSIDPSVPAPLEAITLRCLAKDPAERYRSAEEVVHELERFLRGESIEASSPGAVSRLVERLRRNRSGVALALGLVVSIAVAATAVIGSGAIGADDPRDVLDRIEARLAAGDPVGRDDRDRLEATVTALDDAALQRRRAVLDLLLIITSDRASDEQRRRRAEELAAAVRPSGELDHGLLDTARRTLRRRRLVPELATLLFGASPEVAPDIGAARALALAIADGSAGVTPPPDAALLRPLLAASDAALRGQLLARVARRALETEGPDAALDLLVRASKEPGGLPPESWPEALHLALIRRAASSAEDPEVTRSLLDVAVRIRPDDVELPAELLGELERPLAQLTLSDEPPGEPAEHILGLLGLLECYGVSPLSFILATSIGNRLNLGDVRALADAELRRPAPNPALLLVVARVFASPTARKGPRRDPELALRLVERVTDADRDAFASAGVLRETIRGELGGAIRDVDLDACLARERARPDHRRLALVPRLCARESDDASEAIALVIEALAVREANAPRLADLQRAGGFVPWTVASTDDLYTDIVRAAKQALGSAEGCCHGAKTPDDLLTASSRLTGLEPVYEALLARLEADHHRRHDRTAEEEAAWTRVIAIQRERARIASGDPSVFRLLAIAHGHRAQLRLEAGHPDAEADLANELDDWSLTIRLQREILARRPAARTTISNLSDDLGERARVRRARGHDEEADIDLEEMAALRARIGR